MIESDFIIGKYYRFINPTTDKQLPTFWTPEMSFMNDGEYHKLLSISTDGLLAFEGQDDTTIQYDYINSLTISCIDHWDMKPSVFKESKLITDFKTNKLLYNSKLGLWIIDDYDDTAGTRYLDLYSDKEMRSFNRIEVKTGLDVIPITNISTEYNYIELDLLPDTSSRYHVRTTVRLASFIAYTE